MQFVSLTRAILLDLKECGYNILTSKNAIGDQNPTWYPIVVPDIHEYLMQLDCGGGMVPFEEPARLVIEDALNNLEDQNYIGQVFIEYNHRRVLQYKIHVYDKHYQFIANPEKYNFVFDPQRILIRNHAIHSGDHILYLTYLGMHYPEHIIEEMQDLEELTKSLICLDAAHAREWFINHDIAVMESDIWICDEDAILKILTIQENDHMWSIADHSQDHVYNIAASHDILSLRDIFWIDPRVA